MTMNGNQHRKMWATRDPRFHRFSCFKDVGPNRTDRSRWWHTKTNTQGGCGLANVWSMHVMFETLTPSWVVVPQNHLFLHVSYLWRLYDQPNKHNLRLSWSSMLRVILEATVVYFSHDWSLICLTDLFTHQNRWTNRWNPRKIQIHRHSATLRPDEWKVRCFFVDEKHDWFNVGLVWGWCTTVWFTGNGLVLTTGGGPKNIFPQITPSTHVTIGGKSLNLETRPLKEPNPSFSCRLSMCSYLQLLI